MLTGGGYGYLGLEPPRDRAQLPLLDDDPETDPLDDLFDCDDDQCVGGAKEGESCEGDIDCAPWTIDEVHPQTCATCHDPHAVGTTSGSNTNATV